MMWVYGIYWRCYIYLSILYSIDSTYLYSTVYSIDNIYIYVSIYPAISIGHDPTVYHRCVGTVNVQYMPDIG